LTRTLPNELSGKLPEAEKLEAKILKELGAVENSFSLLKDEFS